MSGDLPEQVARELAKAPTVSRMVGVFREHDGNLAVVDVNGSRIRVPMVGAVPLPGLPVWVESQNGRYVCTGVSKQISPYGTVVTSTASFVKVVPDGGVEMELPYAAGLTLTAGNRVAIDTASYFVTAKLSANQVAPEDPGTGGGGSTPFSGLLVQAVDSGSTNGGAWWTGDVYTMSSTAGGWFYGGGLQSALNGVTSFSSVEIYLPAIRDASWVAPTLNLHTSGSKPGSGFLTYGAAHTPSSRSGWVALPAAWGATMRDSLVGVGSPTHPNTNTIWRGKPGDAMSGALRFSGRR